jgi:Arc/MetJ family transcription regulator
VYRKEIHTPMRTNIEIDDELMDAALKATGFKTKREAVEEGLRALIKIKGQTAIRKLRGKYEWVGDLDAMRRDHGTR